VLNVVSPFYQPILDLRTGLVAHYEALARTPMGGVTHVKLIAYGEQMGFVHLIDLAMLEHVGQFLEREPTVKVAVNISVGTIEQACPELLSRIFLHMKVADRLVFEITESIEVTNEALMVKFIQAVRLLGARIAIDDFGTGFFRDSAVIQRLAPEFLKLSGQIVETAVLENDLDRLFCINRDVTLHGGQVIAERIDHPDKLEFVKKAGIRYGQGYLLGVPQPFPGNTATTVALSA